MNTLITLSFWAKSNRIIAISVLVCCKVILALTAFYAGLCLMAPSIAGSVLSVISWLGGVVAGAGMLFYLGKETRPRQGWKTNYLRRKTADAALTMVAFLFWFGVGLYCQLDISGNIAKPATSNAFGATTFSLLSPEPEKQDRRLFKNTGNLSHWIASGVEHRLEKLVKRHQQQGGGTNTVEKILLTLLVILVAAGLGYLIVGISCSIACSGNEALAYTVLILGGVGLLTAMFFLIRNIMRK